jgi:hypothetical protein
MTRDCDGFLGTSLSKAKAPGDEQYLCTEGPRESGLRHPYGNMITLAKAKADDPVSDIAITHFVTRGH